MKLGKHVKSQPGLVVVMVVVILEARSSCWAIDKNKQFWIHNHNHGAELVKQLMKKNVLQNSRLTTGPTHTHIACDRRDVVVGGGAQWALNLVVARSSMACLQKDYLHTAHINGMHARDIPFLSLSLFLCLSLVDHDSRAPGAAWEAASKQPNKQLSIDQLLLWICELLCVKHGKQQQRLWCCCQASWGSRPSFFKHEIAANCCSSSAWTTRLLQIITIITIIIILADPESEPQLGCS